MENNLNEAIPTVAPADVLEETTTTATTTTETPEESEHENAISSTTSEKILESNTTVTENPLDTISESDADFFAVELDISDVPTEKINENVEDIVQDLENLLGESDYSGGTFGNSSSHKINRSDVEYSQKSSVCEAESTNVSELPSSSTLECDLSGDNEIVTYPKYDESQEIEDKCEATEVEETSNIVTISECEATVVLDVAEDASNDEIEADGIQDNQPTCTDDVQENETILEKTDIIEHVDKDIIPNLVQEEVENDDCAQTEVENDDCTQTEVENDNSTQEEVDQSEISSNTNEKVEDVTENDADEIIEDPNLNEPDSCKEIHLKKEEISENVQPDPLPTEPPCVVEAADSNITETCSVEAEKIEETETENETQVNIESNTEIVEKENDKEIIEMETAVEEKLIEAEETNVEVLDTSTLEVADTNITEIIDTSNREVSDTTTAEVIDTSNMEVADTNITEIIDTSNREVSDTTTAEVIDTSNMEEADTNITEIIDTSNREVSDTTTAEVIDTSNMEVADTDITEIIDASNREVSDTTTAEVIDTSSKHNSELEILPIASEAEKVCSTEEVLNAELLRNITQSCDDKVEDPIVELMDVEEAAQDSEDLNKSDFVIKPDEKLDCNIETGEPQLEMECDTAEADNLTEVDSTAEVDATEECSTSTNSKENLLSAVPTLNTDQNTVTRNTDLDQPLTVEVEEPNFIEEQSEMSETEEHKEGENIIQEDEKIKIVQVEPVKDVGERQKNRAPLKMTITKQSENVHSILKIYDPNEPELIQEPHIPKLIIKSTSSTSSECVSQLSVSEEPTIPKITIKPIVTSSETQHSPRLTIKPIKPPTTGSEAGDKQYSPKLSVKSTSPSTNSPKITIKPIVKPESLSPLRLTIRSVPNSEELQCSPKLTIKPIVKPEEISRSETHSPKITIKPIVKPLEEPSEERYSPRITIKPVLKPAEECNRSETENVHSPRLTIKPIIKPEQEGNEPIQPFKLNIKPVVRTTEASSSPKITIKPVTKPDVEITPSSSIIDYEEQIRQERIVLKIAKSGKKEKFPPQENEKLKKIKLKFSKEGKLAHIVPTSSEDQTISLKRSLEHTEYSETKHFKIGPTIDLTSDSTEDDMSADITITPIDSSTLEQSNSRYTVDDSSSSIDDIKIVPVTSDTVKQPVVEDVRDPLNDIPVFEITSETAAAMYSESMNTTTSITAAPVPRKRGRPRKVPLVVREEFKDPKEEEAMSSEGLTTSGRPKRSCRGPSVRATLGIRPRKPRGAARGRGGSNQRTVSTRATAAKKVKEPKTTKCGRGRMVVAETHFNDFNLKDTEFKQVPSRTDIAAPPDVVIYEEETRMSAENSSRAQTPAKQVLTTPLEIEESQSSVQSSTTTESSEKLQKVRKGPRLEVHQEPEGEVISADKLAEYSWGGGGPYMLQEQVAQFLGIKSFKRKYPGIQRRPVEMQERDFIRETGLASEAMCDMGLTAVRSQDILDIMYTDFQQKYEEYCKHQRDRQAKDVSNKQKALSLAASQEKNKLDIVEQAVQSALQWNANFNKTRREQRRACMDLQTFTIHYPKGKMKQVNKPPMGNYPLALVPGQYTDYYKKYLPSELCNLPLNTLGCKNVSSASQDTEESQSDGSASDSDSSSSDSDSSYSGSSGTEDCKMCSPIVATTPKKVLVK